MTNLHTTFRGIQGFAALAFALCCCAVFSAKAQTLPTPRIIYVNAAQSTGANDGTTWANAYRSLAIAVDATRTTTNNGSANSVEIWVTAGVYRPTVDATGNAAPTDARTKTFALRSGVAMYGGFAGGETTRAQRSPSLNTTILTGDMLGNDTPTTATTLATMATMGSAATRSDNTYHVVSILDAANVILDGFTVTGGQANQTFPNNAGGGIFAYAHAAAVGLTVQACTLTQCYASLGGAAANLCENGSGMTATYQNTNFYTNTANTSGGAILTETDYGSFGTFAFVGCKFLTNRSGYGGAAINQVFGYYATTVGTATYENCLFTANNANYGGAVNNYAYSLQATAATNLTNCNIVANNAAVTGGAGYNQQRSGTSSVSATNTLVWGNTGGGVHHFAAQTGTFNAVTYSNVQDGGFANPVGAPTYHNLSADPLFRNLAGADAIVGTPDDDHSLRPCSPNLNNGINSALSSLAANVDILGNTRKLENTVDIGAVENASIATYTPRNTASASTLAASEECADASGWTHYYDPASTTLLLSLLKGTNAIGNIGTSGFAVIAGGNGATDLGTAAAHPAPYADAAHWYVMNRYWQVTPLQEPTTDVRVRFYFSQPDLDALNTLGSTNLTPADLMFYKINGCTDPNPNHYHACATAVASTYAAAGFWAYPTTNLLDPTTPNTNPSTAAASVATWGNNTGNSAAYYAEYIVHSFSGGGGGAKPASASLPVKLTDFTATTTPEQTVVLNWHTETEQHNRSFEVERSIGEPNNGMGDFTSIGTVAGAGNSTTPHDYTLTDLAPARGNDYYNAYRLRQIDDDGNATLSKIVIVRFYSTKAGLSLQYPNPIRRGQNVAIEVEATDNQNPNASSSVMLCNSIGQTIATLFNGSLPSHQRTAVPMPTDGLAAGTYFIVVTHNAERVVRKVVVE